ncbi:4Fe-4S dicluster domain-containing protein [Parabacteroides sp. Marseille-P3160]|uniref:4Fe-4S dicluster domain-containing protein n=1 Tax=Parabacteroides sp. Marseille-P3160 TaxID=1917887 RepID=UPI0009B940A4|nr:4Fe-4S dicluster domain-containing protein [Parabacteroides sp. Marseille-P3160]
MLKKLRIAISTLLLGLVTFYFLDFASLLPDHSFGWLAKIQFVPALLALNGVVVAVIIILTVLFGRIYCSSVCPMGIFQDIVAWFSRRKIFHKKRKKRYKYHPAKNILRWSVLGITVLAFIGGFTVLLGLIDPYSAYGRAVTALFRPVYMEGNNLLESIFTRFNNYSFYKVEIVLLSLSALIVGAATLLIIGYLAWKQGRTYCNTICPVGTVLGFLSRFSLFKVKINLSACTNCGSCAMVCKASCIDVKNHQIDYSRCVDCFNCLESCSTHALGYRLPVGSKENPTKSQPDPQKRRFLLTGLATAFTIPAALAKDKLAAATGDSNHIRKNPICPPGAQSMEHLSKHCTACHLCISRCPSKVIKPAFLEYGLKGFMQPTMTYEKGFCNYNCTICSEVCPSKALSPLTQEEKHKTQIGRVTFHEEICVVHTEGTNCGACAEHCPTQAVTMIPYAKKEGLTIPFINPEICVGCGGCEYICPVRPYRAIHVEGNDVHQQRKEFKEEKKKEVVIDDFGF